jgi:protein-tyrosine phosphatase
MGFVDLHSHVLYGLDDGAPNQETALALLDGLAALGISEQCVTPHQKASQYLPDLDAIEQTLIALDAVRKPGHPTLRVAAENMWDDVFYQRSTEDKIPSYRGTNAFLVEIPPQLAPPGMARQLFKFRMAGKLPVLAHPERYHALWGNDDFARELRAHCAFVLDLGAIAGHHGKKEMKSARHLLDLGLVAAVATDAHKLSDLQHAADGLRWLDKKLGHATTVRLFDHAPREILKGELPE